MITLLSYFTPHHQDSFSESAPTSVCLLLQQRSPQETQTCISIHSLPPLLPATQASTAEIFYVLVIPPPLSLPLLSLYSSFLSPSLSPSISSSLPSFYLSVENFIHR